MLFWEIIFYRKRIRKHTCGEERKTILNLPTHIAITKLQCDTLFHLNISGTRHGFFIVSSISYFP